MSDPDQKAKSTSKDEYKKQTHCDSCGRFTGVFTRCPYCLAIVHKRLSIKAFKTMALLTSTVGLIILLFVAQRIQTPRINIADIGPLSNFAHVRIEAPVVRSFGMHPEWGSLGFVVEQPNKDGQPVAMRVSAYSRVAADILKQGKVPVSGDVVSVQGQVRFSKDTPSLLINAPEHLEIISRAQAPEPELVPLGKVNVDLIERIISVKGKIASINRPKAGTIINLAKPGKGTLTVWVRAQVAGPVVNSLVAGDEIHVTGIVNTFRGKIQVEPGMSQAIRVLKKSDSGSGAQAPSGE